MPTEQFKHGASSHAEVREEHQLPRDDGIREERDQALLPQRPSAGEYEVWRKDKAVETFGPIVWRLIESCFGKESLGRDFAAALWTDSAYPEQPGLGDIGVLFGSTQLDRKRGPLAYGQSANVSELIADSRHRGEPIGALVHYRPAHSHLLDFAGVPLEDQKAIVVEDFANERSRQWRKISRTADFAPLPVAVHTALEQEHLNDPVFVFVSAPSPILVAAGISPSSTHHRCSTTGEVTLAQWNALDRVLTEMLRTAGGEVTFALTRPPATWQAREVSKRDAQPQSSLQQQEEGVGSHEVVAPPGHELGQLTVPLTWPGLTMGMAELLRKGIKPDAESRTRLQDLTANEPLTETGPVQAPLPSLANVSAPARKVNADPSAGQQPYMAALRELAQRIAVREPRSDDRRTLLSILREARRAEPEDSTLFVDMVNGALEGLGVRLRLSDGALAWLRTTPGKSGKGFIAFQLVGSGKGRGWLKDRVVALDEAENTP